MSVQLELCSSSQSKVIMLLQYGLHFLVVSNLFQKVSYFGVVFTHIWGRFIYKKLGNYIYTFKLVKWNGIRMVS